MKIITSFFLSMFFISLLSSNPVSSQQQPDVIKEDNNGLTTVKFDSDQGAINVYVPSNLYAGDVISGTVIAEPKGKNEKKLEKNKNILKGYVVELEDSQTPVEKGKDTWKIPQVVKGGVLHLLLKDAKGALLASSTIPAHPEKRPEKPQGNLSEGNFHVPVYLRAGELEKNHWAF